ncbi:uncharacterized protein T551_02800 [Pneumocystis jirovecii RU7]|uniref:COX assembly mitochondrial protein n=1 Tax=Pneumocystis jirovecii (strain RU7) TaxID=1408657 RepID=A0A0W4ZHI6_PNEJ7|nr:uncharacterized protein T551_02800 [Pneumocystis jirovecii RU7]KTW27833.1 hypothetical protein T551_02800 [Pneumocystis jirovecii RU7]
MHPPISAHKHPDCYEIMQELEKCHKSGFFNYFLGKCNNLKKDVVQCLSKERLKQQRANQKKKKEKRQNAEISKEDQ